MKIQYILLITIALLFVQCQGSRRAKTTGKQAIQDKSVADTIDFQKGYALMKQKCFICHLEKPDPAKRNQMIAPPMVRVQQHYKPAYPKRNDFVQAVMNYVKNPSEKTTLMPGAVKRFHLMPKLVYTNQELRLIAETLYQHDFQASPGQNQEMNRPLTLNQGKKWVLDAETMKNMNLIDQKINHFSSSQLSDYHQLGKEIFGMAKTVLLENGHQGKAYAELQSFFHNIEDNMHALMAAATVSEAQKQRTILKQKFKKFHQYFK